MSSVPYIDTFMRVVETQILRNGLSMNYGYYASGPSPGREAAIMPYHDDHIDRGTFPIPAWSFHAFIDRITEITMVKSLAAEVTILDLVLPQMYPSFKNWITMILQ